MKVLLLLIILISFGCKSKPEKFDWNKSGYKRDWVINKEHEKTLLYETKNLFVYSDKLSDRVKEYNVIYNSPYTVPLDVLFHELGSDGCQGKRVMFEESKFNLDKIKLFFNTQVPNCYKILYSKTCNKYAVQYMYNEEFFHEPLFLRYTMDSIVSPVFREDGEMETPLKDSIEALNMIQKHWQQILNDRERNKLNPQVSVPKSEPLCSDYQ